MEEEDERQISFLDVMVKRLERKLSTMVPRTAIHTDQYLHFHSHHHPRILSGMVKNLKQRALNVCEPEKLENLGWSFQINGYPKELSHLACSKKQGIKRNGDKNKVTVRNNGD